jgi:thioredoxin 1
LQFDMYTNYIITGIILAAIVYLFLKARAKMKNIPLATDHEKILTLTEANFQHQTKNKLILVDFWASWCVPCRVMGPVLNDVAEKLNGNSHVGKVNIEQHQSLAQKFKVKSIPTLILLNNGIEVKRFVGMKDKEFLIHQITSQK